MNLNKIFESFPPPEFLSIPYAGLYISDSAIRCIKFGRRNNGLYIEKYAENIIPSGVIVGGQINDKKVLIEMLKVLKKQLGLDFVRVSLPEEKAYLFTAKIPIVKSEEVRSAIESKIEENVPVAPGELIFDYDLTGRPDGQLDVVVSTVPTSLIETYVDVLDSANLSPLSLEIESQALARAVVKPDNRETVLILHFRPGKFGLYVISGRVVHFTSTMPIKTDPHDRSEFLLQEIRKLYTYWHTLKENIDKPEKKISQILACGESFDEKDISYLSANGLSVTKSNVWTNVFDVNDVVPEISFKDSLGYGSTVGLALPSEVLI